MVTTGRDHTGRPTSHEPSRSPKSDELDERIKIEADDAEAALAAFLRVDPDSEPTDPPEDRPESDR